MIRLTGASMRGDPATATNAATYCSELQLRGQKDICHEGGFTLEAPSAATYHWGVVASSSPPPGTAYQAGQGTVGGLQIDIDYAATGFPLARFRGAPGGPPPSHP